MTQNITEVIKNIPGAKNISDDIIIYTKEEDHIDTLKAVFARLRAHNLTVNKDKCVFGVPSLEFFGHVFSAKAVTASDSKLSATIEAESPITMSELCSLLRMTLNCTRWQGGKAQVREF